MSFRSIRRSVLDHRLGTQLSGAAKLAFLVILVLAPAPCAVKGINSVLVILCDCTDYHVVTEVRMLCHVMLTGLRSVQPRS
jgi:hypothetical protein